MTGPTIACQWSRLRLPIAAAILLALSALVPAACGKSGPPELPPGVEDQFPHQYPNPDDA